MVALVLVSHSWVLAQALRKTLETLYAGKLPPVAVAAGTGEAGEDLGTDATAIMAAIAEVGAAADGVLVLLDLGSAVLSGELALELLDEPLRAKALLCAALLVEGAIAAAAQSGAGGTLAEVRTEAEGALRQKIEHLGGTSTLDPAVDTQPGADVDGVAGEQVAAALRVENPHGLHAWPAMRIVQAVAPFASAVQIANQRTGATAVSARSLVAMTCLDARPGDTILVTARGPDATEAIAALRALHAAQFGDLVEGTPFPEQEDGGLQSVHVPSLEDIAVRDVLSGWGLSGGIAVGPLFFASHGAPSLPPPGRVADAPTELARLHGALRAVRRQLAEETAALRTRQARPTRPSWRSSKCWPTTRPSWSGPRLSSATNWSRLRTPGTKPARRRRMVGRVTAVAARHGKWTGVCGEAAADPVTAGVLIGLGVQKLSVGSAAVGRLRTAISAGDYQENRRKAQRCLRAASAPEVRRW